MTKAETIKRIVHRFLWWKLPEDFRPDCGIEFDRDKYVRLNPINLPFEPVGTNLLSATQATAMVEAIAGKEIEELQAALQAERALSDRLATDARIMSNYLADYQMDDAESRRCCIDDEHHWRAVEALEAARAALTAHTEARGKE
jgi:hypothetical protein